MNKKLDQDEWDTEGEEATFLERFKLPLVVVGVLAVASIGYSLLSSGGSYESIQVGYLKGEYGSVIKKSEDLLMEVDEYQGAEINLILAKIYSDKAGGYYDRRTALTYLEQAFAVNPTTNVAQSALMHIGALGLPDKQRVDYLSYLAKNKDQAAARELVLIYSKMPLYKQRVKAKQYISKMADTVENRVLQARLHLDKDSGLYNQTKAMTLLSSAANSGSSEALFVLAGQSLVIAKSSPKQASKLLGEYPSMIARAVRLGYRGEGVSEAIEIIKFGRDGVLRNTSLATELEGLVNDN